MNYKGISLRHLTYLSPIMPPASVSFEAGLNVIYGASDTGKSFLVSSIDFMLGAGIDLKDIPERVPYDRVLLGFQDYEGNEYTLERSVQGGPFNCYAGLLSGPDDDKKLFSLASKHNPKKKENVSRFILGLIGLDEKKLRTNKSGDTRSLSFRDLAKFAIVQEEAITKEGSPIESGQVISKTSDYATFKLLLTGVDDSSVVSLAQKEQEAVKKTAKIEVVEQLLEEYEIELQRYEFENPDELDEQLDKLSLTIERHKDAVNLSQQQFTELSNRRKGLWDRQQELKERLDEIDKLQERFKLLEAHYMSDLERLEAIRESGSLFVYQEQVACPLCGTAPEKQPHCRSCSHDVDTVVKAAGIEISKINTLVVELEDTVLELKVEARSLQDSLKSTNTSLESVQAEIEEKVAPQLKEGRASYSDLVDKLSEIHSAQKLADKIENLKAQIEEYEESKTGAQEPEVVGDAIPKTVLEDLSLILERYLKDWHFPETGRVYFDEKAHDFVVAGKPRGSRGKGLRAVTHASFSCGLLDYCETKGLPHPGFVVLDSPLVAYKEPEGDEDDLSGSDLKDQFYIDLASRAEDQQIILIENVEPPSTIDEAQMNLIKFTKNPHEGRYGFFPVASQSV
jgi:rubrerythrin